MKTINRILTIFLCVVLLVSTIPLSSTAISETEAALDMIVNGARIVDTGKCGEGLKYGSGGDNLTYTFYDDGKLIIDGSGKMSKFTLSYDPMVPYQPWSEYREQITSIYISEGVTSIGENAFWNCSNLSEINLGHTIENIGRYAFWGTEYFSNIGNWDGSILYIGDYLIDSSDPPSKIVVKDGTRVIADWAFFDHDTLQTIVLPNSLKTIGFNAFNCADYLEKIVYNGTVEEYCNISFGDNWHFSYHDIYIAGDLATNVVIPEGVENIKRAFDCCKSLVSVSVPSTITNMDSAFRNCCSLREVTIANGIKSVSGFTGCSSLNTLSLPDSVEYLSGLSDTGLQEIVIGKSLKKVSSETFHNCYNLKKVYYTGNINDWCNITFEAYNCNASWCSNPLHYGADLYIENKMVTDANITQVDETLGSATFYNCNTITNVKLGDTISEIDSYAFYDCNSLETVILPTHLKYINYGAFWNCSNLKSITISDSICEVGDNAFANCGTQNLIIADGSITISKAMVIAYSSLKNVYIPKSVTEILNGAFSNRTSISDVYFSGNETEWNKIKIGTNNECLTNATIHFNASSPEEPVFADVKFGADRFTFSKDISGYVGEEISALLVYTSKDSNIASLDITSSNPDIVEIGEIIELGKVEDPFYGDSIGQNEHEATVTLKLKAEGTSTITITSPEGISTSVLVHVKKSSYEIKLYSEIPAMIVGKGKQIGAAVQLENNGVVVDGNKETAYSFASSNANIVALSEIRKESDGTYFVIKGINEGTAVITITENNTGTVFSGMVQVNSGILTFNAEALPSYYNRDNEYNGYIGGMYIDEFKMTEKDKDTMSVTFNVYNTSYIVGSVDVYDKNGNILRSEQIKRFDGGYVTSIKDTLISGYKLIEDTFFTGNLLTYKQDSYSTLTSISFDIPKGGHIEITNDPLYSNTCAIYNLSEFVVSSILMFGDVIDIDAKTQKEVTEIAGKNIVDKFLKEYIAALSGKTSNEKIIKLGEKFTNKLTEKSIKGIMKSSITGELSTLVDEGKAIMSECDINLEEIIISSAGSIGYGIAEGTLKKAMGPFGEVLNGMFKFTEYASFTNFLVDICKPHGTKSLNIYVDDINGCLSNNGVSIKAENGTIDLSKSNYVMHSVVLSNKKDLTGAMKSSLDSVSNEYVVRNIYLERDGKISQPNQPVQVTIPVPKEWISDFCKLYWVQEDGTLTEIQAMSSYNNLVFTTDHFSYYAIVYDTHTFSVNGTITNFGDILVPTMVRLLLDGTEIAQTETISEAYVFNNINPGTYTLEVSKANHVTRTYEITVGDENVTQDVKIHLIGDVNGDGKVNTIDVNRVYAHVRETNPLTGYELECANVAGTDATVNTVDVNRIYAHVKGTNLLW